MRNYLIMVVSAALLTIGSQAAAHSASEHDYFSENYEPPFSGTVYLDPDIITPNDPSAFQELFYTGEGVRSAWHSEEAKVISFDAYLYNLMFDNGQIIEVAVNQAVGTEAKARARVTQASKPLGQVPVVLREHVELVAIHNGSGRATANTGGQISVYADRFDDLIQRGYFEELFIHEATHTSLDKFEYLNPAFREAQRKDNEFVSTYARDKPDREDIAESIVPYIAVRFRADRISAATDKRIRESMRHRIRYFDELDLDFYPTTHTSANIRAELTSPTKNPNLQNTSAEFAWSAPQGATYYDLILGTTGPGSNDIRASGVISETGLSVSNLPSNGETVYARLWTFNQSEWRYEDYDFFGFNPSKTFSDIYSPSTSTPLRSSKQTFKWDNPMGATHFDLIVGNQGPGSNNIRASKVFGGNKIQVANIPTDGGDINVRLWAWANNSWEFKDYVYKAAADRAVLVSPNQSNTLTSAKTSFSWSAPEGTTSVDLLVGTTGPGSTDIRATNVVKTDSLSLDNLPTDGRPIYVRLWSYKDGDWKHRDYVFNGE